MNVNHFCNSLAFAYNEDGEKSVQLEQEVFLRIQNLINQGITFIGIIPSTLQNVFTGLSTTFDNIC